MDVEEEKLNHIYDWFISEEEFGRVNGEWFPSKVLAYARINSFDFKAQTKQRIVIEASKRVAAIYPFINPEKEEAIGLYEFAIDLYTATIPSAREALTGRLLQFKNIYDKAQAAIAVVNASTDWKFSRDYDAVTDPGW